MASNLNTNPQIFRDGTSQRNRSLKALEPDYIAVDERSVRDWLKFVREFAKELKYYDEFNNPTGDWSPFFNLDIDKIIAYLDRPELFADNETELKQLSQPHLVLFLTFLQLLRYPQQQFKQLTRRYLDFYYKEVLRLKAKEEEPDRVNIIFELASDVEEDLLPKGTLLAAGQDSQGVDINYATDRDIVINQAQVANVKTLYIDEIQNFYAASIVEAKEGEAAKLPGLGFNSFKTIPQTEEILVKNSVGFAITSPLLLLREGTREIRLTLACQENTFDRDQLNEIASRSILPFDIYYSSEDQWIALEPESISFDVGFLRGKQKIKDYPRDELSLICTVTEPNTFSAGEYLLFEDGNIYQIAHVDTRTEKVKLTLTSEGNIPEEYINTIKKYDRLDNILEFTGDLTPLSGLSWKEEEEVIEATQDIFTEDDEDKFLVWSDGRIYQIEKVVSEKRVNVRRWGYIPLENNTIKKYDDIVLKDGSPVLSDLDFTSIAISQSSDYNFVSSDVKKLIVWDNGKVFKIEEIVNDKEAKIETIGTETTVDLAKAQNIEQYNFLNTLEFILTVQPSLPAIAPLQGTALTETEIDSPYPIIKLLLKNSSQEDEDQQSVIYYEHFKSISLKKVIIQVDVHSLQELLLRNDFSILSSPTTFQPFGDSPKVGSGFYFYNTEVCQKKLDSLSIYIEWRGLPEDFDTHYTAYDHDYNGFKFLSENINNESFTTKLKFFSNRKGTDIETKKLFQQNINGLEDSVTLSYQDFNKPGYSIDASLVEIETDDPLEQNRYFKLELQSPDFLHALYPLVLNEIALLRNSGNNLNSGNNSTPPKVFPPYTPEIKAISLDYTATAEIDLTYTKTKPKAIQIFQVHPFGYINIRDSEENSQNYLLPQFDYQGAIFIGIGKLKPPQNLSFLMQMVAGSGEAELGTPNISWSYLSDDRWQDFLQTEILADNTNGLIDTGIIRLSIPAAATNKHHLMPSGLHWLRATVAENAAAIPDILDIRTQAAIATYLNLGNAPDRLSKPLAANSIQGLVEPDSAIVSVMQPYSSFGGKMKEDSRTFYVRVSERLRHKQRALTIWDYERLVLERFPEIYKVKCLSQASFNNSPSDAKVTVVVIPDISNTAPFFPLEPKAPLYLLEEIKAYLKAHISPFVKLTVKNPRYERIRYRLAVRLNHGFDRGYYLGQLNEDIKRFLSPWAYEEEADITFGSSIHSSSLIYFVEKRRYVDYVANLKLIDQVEIVEGKPFEHDIPDQNLAQVHSPDSILVSGPEHFIDLITTETYDPDDFVGIGYMIIEVDFIVS